MIQIDQDDRRTMYVTRGDHTGDGNNIIAFRYPIYDAVTKQKTYYKFKPTDKIAFVVKKKKGYTKKEVFRVEHYLSEAGYTEETEAPEIVLTEEDTKNFTLLNKRQTYWYDIVLNDGVTILGYDLDGASKIVVFPEAGEGDEDDDDEIIYVYPDLEDIVITPSMEEQYFKSEKYGYDHVIVEAIQADELSINSSTDDQEFEGLYKKVSVEGIETTELNVTPSTEAQTFEGLYDKVSVGAVEEVEADELNIVPSKQAQNFEGLYDKVSVEAIQAEQLNVTPSQDQQSFTGLYDAVNVDAIEGETLNASSSTQSQSFTGLYDEVNISGIQTDTLNVTPSQQQQSFTGLYDEVNVSAIEADTLNIAPTKEAQTRTGLYNQVNVSGDNNLVAGNIKKNVSIFGVIGSYEETPSLQSKSVTITENGTQTVSPDTGYDGLSSVAITTNVAGTGNPYKRLEYIESTGTQRIDTGITPDNTTEFEMKYNQTAINGQFDTIIGGQASNTGIFVMPTFNSTVNQKSLRYNTTENKTSTTNSYYQVDTTLTLKQNVFTFDNGTNQESITTGSYSSFSAAQPLWLFALNNGGTSFGLAKMKLYYCKIWKNNKLVRDLIPVKMIESGNVGLFDKVNQEFLSNAGSGTFTAGAVLPDEDEWYIDNAAYLFYQDARINKMEEIIGKLKNVTTTESMFNNCSISSAPMFDMSQVKNMKRMFYLCAQLQTLPLYNTSNVENIESTFGQWNRETTPLFNFSKVKTANNVFEYSSGLITAQPFNLSSATTTREMFVRCSNLANVPVYSLSSVTSMYNMFSSCSSLSNESLNNILETCISAVQIPSSDRTLKRIGLSQAQATTCQGLSNYQAFLDAGWTTGY